MTTYTDYHDIQGIIYKDEMNRKCLMCADELHKFSDGTLNYIRTALGDINQGIQMDYLPKRKWSKHVLAIFKDNYYRKQYGKHYYHGEQLNASLMVSGLRCYTPVIGKITVVILVRDRCPRGKDRIVIDKQRARVMINAIDKKLKDRRLMRNLEKFVGGRPYKGDLRLLERTI
ncbi:hypothetical protein Tco_0039387 [Tanacetum coccineum]